MTTQQTLINGIDVEVLGGRQLDFGQAFLPESLARSAELDFLDATERRLHNQIRGHGYLMTFGLVEEFILPFVIDHTRETWGEGGTRRRALDLRDHGNAGRFDHAEREKRNEERSAGSARNPGWDRLRPALGRSQVRVSSALRRYGSRRAFGCAEEY